MASLEYPSLSGPKRLGDRFLEAGLITRTQLDVALERQRTGIDERQRLGRTLVALGVLTDRDLTKMLSVHFAIPVAPFSIAEADEQALLALPADLARRHQAVPCRVGGGSLLVAVADAMAPPAIEELAMASGLPVVLYLTSENEIEVALPKHYDGIRPSMFSTRLRALAGRLLQLADAHERIALTRAAESTPPADEAHLRTDLEPLRADIEAVLRSLADRSGQPRQHDAAA